MAALLGLVHWLLSKEAKIKYFFPEGFRPLALPMAYNVIVYDHTQGRGQFLTQLHSIKSTNSSRSSQHELEHLDIHANILNSTIYFVI